MSNRCYFVKEGGVRILIPMCMGSVNSDVDDLSMCTCPRVSGAMWEKAGKAFEMVMELAPKKDAEAKAEWMRAVAYWLNDAASRSYLEHAQ